MNWLEVVPAIPWAAWLSPLLLWGIFVLLSYLVMLFLDQHLIAAVDPQ